jgi:hypothetical protein
MIARIKKVFLNHTLETFMDQDLENDRFNLIFMFVTIVKMFLQD